MSELPMMLLLLLIPWNWTLVTPALWNAAKWKPAFQSSDKVDWTWSLYEDNARRAVDGNRTTISSQGSCSLTLADKPSWLMVDLQSLYSVTKILLANRLSDGLLSSDALKNFDVQFFENDPRNNPLFPNVHGDICVTQGNSSLPSGDNTFNCEPETTGRFGMVKYHSKYEEQLSLCEFEVYVETVSSTSVAFNGFTSTRVTNSEFLTLQSYDILSCANECSSRRDQELCTAFNWNQARRECRLLSVYPYDPVDQVSDAGWDLYRVVTY